MGEQKPVQVEFEKLQTLFDIAVNSLDFGSGFLDNDEVTLLREIAVVLGVDPMNGTPSGFAKQYKHAYAEPAGKAWISATTGQPVIRTCIYCSGRPDDQVHDQDAVDDR